MTPPLLWRDDGTLVSEQFGDVYFAAEDGLAESRYVFCDGNDLAARFATAQRFVIGETGFGTGLNAAAAFELWQRTAPAGAEFVYYSVEKYPLSADDRLRALSRWPELAAAAHAMEPHIRLLIGDAATLLPTLPEPAGAWFLDGFAPVKNPDMWSPAVLAAVAQQSHLGTTFATFTAASAVREGLRQVGFTVTRVKGFGRKRHMLRGVFTP
jgi:tRNA 5-methylaminomethyl-2-thiouridine biosynthesis bifunctional protein